MTSYSITITPYAGQVLEGKFFMKMVGDSSTEQFQLNEVGSIEKSETYDIKNVNIGDVWAIETKITANNGNKFL